jgi:hypothetical protein
MELKDNRGTILQITFDILYPNGQLKTVTMSLADTSEQKDVGLIVFNEDLLKKFVLDKLDEDKAKDILAKWNSKDVMLEGGGEAPFNPAMVLVSSDEEVTLKCGGHGSSGHIGHGTAVNRYM